MAAQFNKPEFPPLLAPGLHPYSMDGLRKLCVEDQPKSKRREELMAGLEGFVRRLGLSGLPCRLWIDGSFLTSDPYPGDVDIVVGIPEWVQDSPTAAQQSVLEMIEEGDELFRLYGCQVFRTTVRDDSDALRWIADDQDRYWNKQYGESRAGSAKGIAVVAMGVLR
jgi:hypothetical protein